MNESVEELLDVLEPFIQEDSVSVLTESIRIKEAKKVYEKYRPSYTEGALDRLNRIESTLRLTGDIPAWAERLESDDDGHVMAVGIGQVKFRTLIVGDDSRSDLKAAKKCSLFRLDD